MCAYLLTNCVQGCRLGDVSRFSSPGEMHPSPDDGDTLTPDVREQRRRILKDPWSGRSAREKLDRAGFPDEDAVRTDAGPVLLKRSDDELWLARWVFAEQGSGLVVRSLTVEPLGRATPTGGVTANLLRELSPAGAVVEAADLESAGEPRYQITDLETGEVREVPTELLYRWTREDAQAHGPDPASTRRPGRPSLPERMLAAVAELYLAEMRRGRGVLKRVSARPELAAAAERRQDAITVENVRDWVRIARRNGWLRDDAQQGKRGGAPGPRLIEWRANIAATEGEES